MLTCVTGLLVTVLSQQPSAGAPDAGSEPVLGAVAADTDAMAPAEVERFSGLDGGEATPVPPAPALADAAASDGGTSAIIDDEGIDGRIGASLRLSQGLSSAFPLDDLGTAASLNPFQTRLRVAPELHYRGFGFLAEFDAASGAIVGVPDSSVVAERVPYRPFTALELRQAYLEYRWKTGAARVGQQTSQWGLGLLANPGSTDAQAGDFGQQHGGTLAYRARVAFRPFFSLGGLWQAFEPALAVDLVVRDNLSDVALGDRVWQGVVALRVAIDDDRDIGIYAVYRHAGVRASDLGMVDVAGKWSWSRHPDRAYSLGFEVVGITGTATQSGSDTAAVLKVRQFGAAIKSAARYRAFSLMVDWGYASGDQNPFDDRVESFRFDRDYKVGLILFDQVLGYQSARSAKRAADPALGSVPPGGVDLLPTGGSVTSAWYLFPRVKYGFAEWVDLYGGPLFAFSTAALADPYNTGLGGGATLNYLAGTPGRYLGTELDVGLQMRFRPARPLLLTGTLEGGLFMPGDAFAKASGAAMGPIGMGRLRLSLCL